MVYRSAAVCAEDNTRSSSVIPSARPRNAFAKQHPSPSVWPAASIKTRTVRCTSVVQEQKSAVTAALCKECQRPPPITWTSSASLASISKDLRYVDHPAEVVDRTEDAHKMTSSTTVRSSAPDLSLYCFCYHPCYPICCSPIC
ncbi:hypothetical protein B9Z55_003148 [Caenorhabditis nigoni]|uniref:Uncharacterized protein n=1 Tax=Caenorhabditis nigoni TaxID=1611254 RepID=A0A2G5VNR0_9PELO|nr:hypothetical protein B9Z55_003148 [Caenorhabditis nigoni]